MENKINILKGVKNFTKRLVDVIRITEKFTFKRRIYN